MSDGCRCHPVDRDHAHCQRGRREPDTRAENVCMHDVSMRDECRACYAIDESQHDALVQAVDSLAELDPCRDDTYHLDEE